MGFLWLAGVAVGALAAAAQSPASAPPHDAMRASLDRQRASVAAQMAAVRRQAETAGVWLPPGDPPPPVAGAGCDPLPEDTVEPLIESAATANKIEPKLLRAVIERESGFRPCATSPKGAMGLMQLMPATAEELAVRDPFDPRQNVDGGAKFLKQMLDRFGGDLAQGLGAYNAGPAAVDQAGGIPNIPETRGYVDAILAKMGVTHTVQPSSPKPKPTGN